MPVTPWKSLYHRKLLVKLFSWSNLRFYTSWKNVLSLLNVIACINQCQIFSNIEKKSLAQYFYTHCQEFSYLANELYFSFVFGRGLRKPRIWPANKYYFLSYTSHTDIRLYFYFFPMSRRNSSRNVSMLNHESMDNLKVRSWNKLKSKNKMRSGWDAWLISRNKDIRAAWGERQHPIFMQHKWEF